MNRVGVYGKVGGIVRSIFATITPGMIRREVAPCKEFSLYRVRGNARGVPPLTLATHPNRRCKAI